MIDWHNGLYMPGKCCWRFINGDFEVLVAGTPTAPDEYRLLWAKQVSPLLDRYCESAMHFIDAFVDRKTFAPSADWHLCGAEFGSSEHSESDCFLLRFQIDGDEYGLWSVGFRTTGLDAPHDVAPFRFERLQR